MPDCSFGSVAMYLSRASFMPGGKSDARDDSAERARSILGTHSVVRCSENVFCCVK